MAALKTQFSSAVAPATRSTSSYVVIPRTTRSGHDNPRMIGGLGAEGRNEVGHLDCNVPDGVPHPHAEEGCYLVVSGATGP